MLACQLPKWGLTRSDLLRSNLEEVKMRSLTNWNTHLDDIFREMNRYAVGFEPTFRMLDKMRTSTTDGYPPYDLESIDNDHYRLSMAVAGFKAEDLEITLQDGMLEILGKSTAHTDTSEQRIYLHKGIAGRSFRRVFYLNAWWKVTNTQLADGILTIDFEQELPESMKPRKIEIKTSPGTING